MSSFFDKNHFLIRPLLFLTIFVLGGAALIWGIKKLPSSEWRDLKNSRPIDLNAQNPTPPQKIPFWPANAPEKPINFLLLGAAGEGNDAPDLTDTILIARVEPDSQKIYLFSLPRDLWVKISGGLNYTKLNALYAINKKNSGHEFDLIKQKAQDITGLAIDHYVFVNLNAVKETVNILKGVNVQVKKDIYDTAYPGPNHSYQTFELKAGWRYLDGETALQYIRSRHSTSDFDRIERQQDILQALKQKVTTLNFWQIGTFYDLYNVLSANVKTDISLWQLNNYWEEFRNIPGENLIKNELTDMLTTGGIYLTDGQASVVRPKAGIENYTAIKNYVNKIIENN